MHKPAGVFYRAYCFLASPNRRKFFIYLGLVWILNAADVWQTLALKSGGHLASEANQFVNYILTKGPLYFFTFKALAVVLVSLVLIRGYFDDEGIRVGETFFGTDQVRTAIQFMLVVGIVYYLFVVYLPLLIVVGTYYSM